MNHFHVFMAQVGKTASVERIMSVLPEPVKHQQNKGNFDIKTDISEIA